jgi:ABC-type antimicrobial peptide transport system permease subunit
VYQGSVNDLVTLSSVALIVAAVGLIACVVPARRALRLDPAAALYLE